MLKKEKRTHFLLTSVLLLYLLNFPSKAQDLPLFDDEKKAMELVQLVPSNATLQALSTIRLQHTLAIDELAQDPNLPIDKKQDYLALALAYAWKAAYANPDNVLALQYVGIRLAESHDPLHQPLAMDLLSRAQTLSFNSDIALTLASLYAESAQYSNAINMLENLLHNNQLTLNSEQHISAILLLNGCYLAAGMYERGLSYFIQQVSMQPDSIGATMAVSIQLQMQGQYQAAQSIVRPLMESLPPDNRHHGQLEEVLRSLVAEEILANIRKQHAGTTE